jgi:hypothetical protein
MISLQADVSAKQAAFKRAVLFESSAEAHMTKPVVTLPCAPAGSSCCVQNNEQ